MNDHSCRICGGNLKPQHITHMQPYQGHYVLIENLPALVCEQCGEVYLTPDSHDQIVALLKGGAEPVRTESLPVYDLSA